MKRIFVRMLSLILSVYIGIGVLLFIKQRDFLYFPVGSVKPVSGEEIFINGNESIKVTVLNKGNRNAIIYFGGNAEVVDGNAQFFPTQFPEHTVFLVKYRGYGGSTGTPTEEGIYSDALYIFDKIKPRFGTISLIGRSLGSGVATLVASKRDIHKLVLITPFDSIQNIAQEKFPIYPMSLLLKDKYNSVDRVSSIKAKTFVIVAENDEIIGMKHTEKLVKKFPSSQITLAVIKGKGHNTISNNEEYYNLLKGFINN